MSVHKITVALSTLAFLAFSASACTSETATQESVQSEGDDLTAGAISAADIKLAESLDDAGKILFLDHPQLSGKVAKHVLSSGSFDGSASTTSVVKDGTGRKLILEEVNSGGGSGAAPVFSDARYFLVLDQTGLDWVLKQGTEKRAAVSAEHIKFVQSFSTSTDTHDYADFGVIGGARVILFNSSELYTVTGTTWAQVVTVDPNLDP